MDLTPAEADALRRRELLRSVSFVGAPASLAFGVWYAAVGAWASSITSIILTALYLGAVMYARRGGLAFTTFGVLGFLATIASMIVIADVTGGPLSPALYWVNLPPMIAYFVLGPRAGAVVFAGACVATVVIGFVMQAGNVDPAAEQLRPFVPLFVVGCTYAFTTWMERSREASFRMVVQANEELTRARDEAERAHRAKSELVAMVSHELRTPLNAIVTANELLLASTEPGNLDEGQRDHLRTSRAAAASLAGLVSDLLDASRLDARRIELVLAPTNVVEVVKDVLQLTRQAAADRGLALEARLPDSAPLLFVDAGRLRQIVTNLVDNAVKFTARGRVEVELRVTPRGAEADVEVRVRDTGIGIAPAYREAIFERFRQADSSTTRRYGGTGLGLAIARELASLMGGVVELAESAPETGSVFHLRFTARQVAEPAPSRTRLEGVRVLLAEDNAVNQRLVALMLEAAGAAVDVASDGRAAVELAGQRDYDVVLMDCYMPEVDGFVATATLRERGVRTPILAVTAGGTPEDVERARQVGMDDLLTKPVDVEQICAALDRVAVRTSA